MAEKQHISLLKLQQIIKTRLDQAMPLPVWVTAEISELKVNYSGHCYLELVEKGGKNAIPRAKASAVVWRSQWGAISSFFRSTTGSELSVGMNILMKVSVSYHELYGLSLVVTDIDPVYTMGDIQRQRRETIERLKSEGVYDMNRELGFPLVVQRIAVVSSANAAGYQDFMNELSAGPYRFEVTLFDAFMQGHSAEDSLVDALERVLESGREFDAVVIIRGGGSQSDLAAFDSYRLSCHIAQFPLPVLTGIGHDKDESVADLVAALSLKTPTAVAGWLVDSVAEVDNWFATAGDQLLQGVVQGLESENRRVQRSAIALSQTTASLTRSLEARLSKAASELSVRVGGELIRRAARLDMLRGAVAERAGARITGETSRLELASQMASSRNPERILSLGFAIVRKSGSALTSSDSVRVGDLLDITLSGGKVGAKVESIEKNRDGE